MKRDTQRLDRVKDALRAADLDALLCALPANVLLLSGYWPVVGTSLALVTREGRAVLLVPEDERDLATAGWADEIHTVKPASLHEIRSAAEAVRGPLREAAHQLGIGRGRVGFEGGLTYEPASYASCHLYGAGMIGLLQETMPDAVRVSATDLLHALRAVKTPAEIRGIRTACAIAGQAFQAGARQFRPGLKETEAAALFQTPLSTIGTGYEGVRRAGGFAFCMAGTDSAQAHGAYARSRAHPVPEQGLALVHCNSYADGYWTDITRTYCFGRPEERQRQMYEAVFAARAAALAAIRPGVRAADVDRAARETLQARGFGKEFKHSTGHGVGFAAIDHDARPRLHPCSTEVLEAGMVFNVEPAIYLDGYGGLRQCDVVTVTDAGAEVLTAFQDTPASLQLA